MAAGLVVLVVAAFVIALSATWIYSLVDVVRTDDATFAGAGQNKIMWVLLIVFLGIIGSVLYFAIARPKLQIA